MTHVLSEAESKRVLAAHGIPVLDERTTTTPDGAVATAAALGYPVVVKLCGPGIAHKTERGLVRLALADAGAVRGAGTELLAAAVPTDGPVELLVAPMVRGARELIAGVHADPQFGRCVMVGVGGILAEAVGDVAFRLVPLERVDAEEMLEDLATGAVLDEFRGEPPADREAVAEVLLGLSRLAQQEPALVSVDVNPMILVDGKPVAVDALVEVERS
ncbi:MAG: acetate--CoA ligase family protein [Acidimicrobiia bacterium]